jgi:phage-related minor tail protein
MGWIGALRGPRLGSGNAIHHHGTTAGLEAYRPGAFGLTLPGQQQLPGFIAEAGRALQDFGITTNDANSILGSLGNEFGLLGQILSQIGIGGGAGSGGGLSGIFGSLMGAFGLPGFERGGATGGTDPRAVAGLVHEQEYVFDAAATARIGVENLEAIRRGTMRGYAAGGYVGQARAYPFLVAGSDVGQSVPDTRPVINFVNQTSVSAEVEVQDSTDARGQRQYSVVMSELVATGMSGGAAKRQMQSTYGMRQRGTARQ